MPLMEWSEQFDLKVEQMNDQHRVLIRLMNDLYDLNDAQAAKSQISTALVKLGDASTRHFAEEEEYMESIGYPEQDFERHKLIHKDLLARYAGHVEEFEASDGTLSQEFFNFLRLWLAAHIKGIDMKYASFAHSKESAA